MKKVLFAMMSVVTLVFSLGAHAGDSTTGYVNVTTSGSTITLVGSMNNRYSSDTGSYVGAYGVANGGVTVIAEADDGTNFNCFFSTSSSMIDEARNLRTSMGNGAIIQVTRTTTSSYCTSLNIQTDSRFLD